MNYEESLAWIAHLQGRGWRLGLDRMQAFVRAARLEDVVGGSGSPIRYLHVAGTNGKGSVTAYLQSMLVAQGFCTGGYFSPYVVDPRERIQIGGELISKEEFAIVATELRAVAETFDGTEIGGITEFEFKTAMGFLAWKRAGVEVVALEVGLGGRLDATNIVTPAACAIVSISLDHTSILGHTETEIAREKAGILKRGISAVVGQVSEEALIAIETIASEVGAPLLRVGDLDFGREVTFWAHPHEDSITVTTPGSMQTLTPGISGSPQMQNAAVAYATLEVGGYLRDPEAASRALANTRLVGRMQWIEVHGRKILVDGAHNEASAATVVSSLVRTGKYPWTAIVGMLDGHDPERFLGFLGSVVGRVLAVRIDNPRSLPPEKIAEAATAMGLETVACTSLEEAFTRAEDGATVVTGSFYLVGEAMRLADSL